MRFLFLLLFFSLNANASETKVESYLNNIRTFTANFSQIDALGNKSTGKFYLQRPGKFRWEYVDQPILIVSNSGVLTYFDEELNEVTKVPADETLAAFLAREKIAFTDDIRLLEYKEKDGFLKVVVTQEEKPEEGNLAMYFDQDPMQLIMLEVENNVGETTRVFFDDQDFESKIDSEKFVFRDPNFHKNAWE